MNTQEIKNKIEQDFFIVRDDDVLIRDCFGFPETLYANWDIDFFNSHIDALNEKAKKHKINHTYRAVRIYTYKKGHPDFKF